MVVEGVEYSGFCLKRAERNHENPWSGFPVSCLRTRGGALNAKDEYSLWL